MRAGESLIEYNWISRPASYPGDLMSCEHQCGGTGSDPLTQKMTLRGNVIVQGQPANRSQIIALFNDETGGSNDGTGSVTEMELTMIHNTIIGTPVDPGKTQRLVNMRNDSVGTTVHLHNNIIYEIKQLAVANDSGASNWSVDGKNNWISADAEAGSGLTGTIIGGDPGFNDSGNNDYTLGAGTACVGKAAVVSGAPVAEYYRDESIKLQYRVRASADDLGAFEHDTSGDGIGPYGAPAPPPKDAGPVDDAGSDDAGSDGAAVPDGAIGDSGPSGDASSDTSTGQGPITGTPQSEADDSGCSCHLDATHPVGLPLGLLLVLLCCRFVRRSRGG